MGDDLQLQPGDDGPQGAQLLQLPQARNSPEEPHHHPLYTPLLQLDNNSVTGDLASLSSTVASS